MQQYEMFELSFYGPEPKGSWVEVELNAEFTHGEESIRVRGFYKGEGVYAVRFLPMETGDYHYTVSGILQAEGDLVCEVAAEGRHGIVRAEGTHFRYADGTWYYPFGTTVYALVHQQEALVDQTMETLANAPFNKIRMCVFPKHYEYNTNEPPYFAFERKEDGGWDMHRPCMAYWEMLERRLRELDAMGIQSDLIVFHPYDRWGFSKLPVEDALVYLDYLTRRLSAFPNLWWSLANEYELLVNYRKEDWETFARFLHEHDNYGHLLSNHNIFTPWDFSNPDATHICVQIKNVDAVSRMINRYQKPMMVDECRYEGNLPQEWGNISGFEMVNRFWKVCAQGAYCTHGETFMNPENVIWWAAGGKLIGESPRRIAFLREIVESLPGPITYGKEDYTEEELKEKMAQPFPENAPGANFVRLMKTLEISDVLKVLDGHREFIGRVGEEAYLRYYGRDCTCIGELSLPEDQNYRVEVIDVWEMTRTTALEGVSGKVSVDLPGKEGIAVLATRMA
ncbi:MAG: DUF5060 domain-containing protein [Eubacteriales bacterium]|nr:DUF5060 domain-containing protein [Eubacteriales bacterium]